LNRLATPLCVFIFGIASLAFDSSTGVLQNGSWAHFEEKNPPFGFFSSKRQSRRTRQLEDPG